MTTDQKRARAKALNKAHAARKTHGRLAEFHASEAAEANRIALEAKALEKTSEIDKSSLYRVDPATATLELVADASAHTEQEALATLVPVHQALAERKIEYHILSFVAENGLATVRTYLIRRSQPTRKVLLPEADFTVMTFVGEHIRKVGNRRDVWAVQKVAKAKRMLTVELDIPLGAVPQLIALCAAYL